mgnify:CR=1 FL=1
MEKIDIPRLKNIVGEENVKNDPADLFIYGSDSSVHSASPWVVVRPENTEQVQQVMAFANQEKIPVITRGGGSGMCGQTVAVRGGITLDMKRMNKILEINPSDVFCRVQPGVVDDDLNYALKPFGVFYPPTPASSRIATIGGEIGNNASGVRSVKYGATRDSVLGMKVVLANGSLVSLGARTRVEATGYQLHKLIVGSEGTLGEMLGLDAEWAKRAIASGGNYGEIFAKNIGEDTPIGLARGLNAQWTEGGLLYSPPFR